VGLGFLATVREDGGPRLHPVCPVIAVEGLYMFVVPSPKRADLRRDGRYALHSYPPEEVDDEFFVTGRAAEVRDPASGHRWPTLTTTRSKKDGLSSPSTSNDACTRSTGTGATGRRPTRSGQIRRPTRIEKRRHSRWSPTIPGAVPTATQTALV
jgi:hypothetical protein